MNSPMHSSYSSPHCKKSPLRESRVKSAGRSLGQEEDSEAVWNELFWYKKRCEEMEKVYINLFNGIDHIRPSIYPASYKKPFTFRAQEAG